MSHVKQFRDSMEEPLESIDGLRLIEFAPDVMPDMLGWITIGRWLWSKLRRKRAGRASESTRILSIDEVGDRRIHEMVMDSLRTTPFGEPTLGMHEDGRHQVRVSCPSGTLTVRLRPCQLH